MTARARRRSPAKPVRRSKSVAATKPAPSAPSAPRECACGCGRAVRKLFAQGHDARVKSLLSKVLRGEAEIADLPEQLVILRRAEGVVAALYRKAVR
jgi:hypothetical protein